jgi:hypothetical protein
MFNANRRYMADFDWVLLSLAIGLGLMFLTSAND